MVGGHYGHLLLVALMMVAGTALAGCSSETSGSPAENTSAASRPIDLSRLADLKGDFPPGFTPAPPSGPSKVRPDYADQVSDTVSYGSPFSVDPPECRPLFDPVQAVGDADRMGIGAGGPAQPFVVVSAVSAVEVPVALPSTGCDRMTFEVEGALPDGVAERLDAPNIDGVQTYGLKAIFNGGGIDYFYRAIVDGRTYVAVWARMDPDFQPEPALPDLLSKAVAAISG